MNSRKTKLIIIACLCVVVLGLLIGYAALSASLKIEGAAKVESKWDVIFLTDEIETTKTGTAECKIGTVTGTSIEGMSVVFNKPGDACTFTVPVQNKGNIPARLVDVTGKSSNLTFLGESDDQDILRNNVTYEVNYGKNQIKSTTDFSTIPALNKNGNYTDFKNSAKLLAFPDPKYYNLYKVGTTRQKMPASSTLSNSQKACSGGVCYGQALSETSGWYGDGAGFIYRQPWLVRGGGYSGTSSAGVFLSSYSHGDADIGHHSRFVFTP